MDDKKITIMDGGMGRLLKEIGAPFRRPEWSALTLMEAPDFVEKAHNQFIEAGAEIIITNSYAIVPFHIGQERFDSEGHKLIKMAAKIARECADKANHKVLVAGSIPPAFGSYRADFYEDDKAEDIYRPLIEEQESYIDIWLAETVTTIQEVIKIRECLGDTKKPFWISYTLLDREDNVTAPQLRSGETIEQAVKTAIDLKADAVLFNCSQPEEMEPALDIIQSLNIDISYGVYANAFEPILKSQKANSDETIIRPDKTPENYLKFAQKWVSQGASIIGGCCGIMPEHIKKLSENYK
jgi:homocysteine S-methyltransferase